MTCSVAFCDIALDFMFQVEVLTVTGQDCTVGKTVGCFVSQAIDRVVEKRLLANMSWQGTTNKWPFNIYDNIIDAIKSEEAIYSHVRHVLHASRPKYMPILAFSRGNPGKFHKRWPGNR